MTTIIIQYNPHTDQQNEMGNWFCLHFHRCKTSSSCVLDAEELERRLVEKQQEISDFRELHEMRLQQRRTDREDREREKIDQLTQLQNMQVSCGDLNN